MTRLAGLRANVERWVRRALIAFGGILAWFGSVLLSAAGDYGKDKRKQHGERCDSRDIAMNGFTHLHPQQPNRLKQKDLNCTEYLLH